MKIEIKKTDVKWSFRFGIVVGGIWLEMPYRIILIMTNRKAKRLKL